VPGGTGGTGAGSGDGHPRRCRRPPGRRVAGGRRGGVRRPAGAVPPGAGALGGDVRAGPGDRRGRGPGDLDRGAEGHRPLRGALRLQNLALPDPAQPGPPARQARGAQRALLRPGPRRRRGRRGGGGPGPLFPARPRGRRALGVAAAGVGRLGRGAPVGVGDPRPDHSGDRRVTAGATGGDRASRCSGVDGAGGLSRPGLERDQSTGPVAPGTIQGAARPRTVSRRRRSAGPV
ncbi:MAG: RNA polymerase ECF-type sigma factor, partial [uncultured Thermomicrobiales bacterium]